MRWWIFDRSFQRHAIFGRLMLRREWKIVSDISTIEPLVAEVVDACLHAGVSARACRLNVSVALTEALSNAIVCGNHCDAAKLVRASMALDSTSLTLEVTDEGAGFDAANVMYSPNDTDWLEREEGRGLFLMRALMDRVELHKPNAERSGHTVRLVLHRA
ncbi:MAG: ATP-binding protein [Gemmatimonadota bacterium]|nr:ATP-binding protein [Gemmatimonadota bacterium]